MCKVDAAERITSTAPIHPFTAAPWHTAHSLLRASQLMVCQQKGFCSCVVLLRSPAVPLADLLPQGPSGNLSHQMPAWRLEKRSRIITEKLILPRKKEGCFFCPVSVSECYRLNTDWLLFLELLIHGFFNLFSSNKSSV